MNTVRAFFALSLLPLLSSCSGLSSATQEVVADSLLPARYAAPKQARNESLVAAPDTASLPYRDLQQFLPPVIDGFVREGAPRGESVQLGGISYSTCEQHYRKGRQYLKVQVVDYNGARALYDGATALMSSDFLEENDELLTRGCNLGLPGVRGYETVQKMEHRASIALGVGGRFFVSVESTGQDDTQLVTQVARNLNLRGLAAL